jgi:hypothetical protein
MPKSDKLDLKTLSPEALLEGFVTEAKLEELGTSIGTVERMNEHGARSRAYAAEIVARGGSESLIALFKSPDDWIAYSAAVALVIHDETKDIALATLDRIADECSGGASFSADIGRNMIRYGDPLGDPVAVEKELAEIRARDEKRLGEIRGRDGAR